MILKVIGCSGSFPGPQSPASCYLVQAATPEKTWNVLFDLGSGALGALQRQMDLSDLDAIFLSHLHPDHCMDVCGLHVAIRWDPRGFKGGAIDLYGPRDTAERMAIAYGMPVDPGMHSEFVFKDLAARQPVQMGPLTIEPFAMRHPVEEAYGFRITETHEDGTTRVLAYSGDTDTCPELVELGRDADLFLCEAAYHEGRDDEIDGVHLTGKRAGQAAADADAKRLLLTHLPVWNDPQLALTEARETYAGETAVAAAGVVYEV